MAIAGYGALTDASGARRLTLRAARFVKDDMLVVKVDGVGDRDSATALTNLELFVPRAQLPPPDEDEFYLADLEGLEARLEDGTVFGRVRRVENYGAGDILLIERPDGEEAMIAFLKINVPLVDLAGGYVLVAPPAEISAAEDKQGDV